MIIIVWWQSDLANTKECLLPFYYKPYDTNESSKCTESGGHHNVVKQRIPFTV